MSPDQITDEQISAWLDGELHPTEAANIDRQLANSDFAERVQQMRSIDAKLRALGDIQFDADREKWHRKVDQLVDQSEQSANKPVFGRLANYGMMAAMLAIGLSLSPLLFPPEQQIPIEATWVYRATGAHQMVSVGSAWQPYEEMASLPGQLNPLLEQFQGQKALASIGYVPVGWRVASDGHSLALQLLFASESDPSSEATVFLRPHVEPDPQGSGLIEVNGIQAFYNGAQGVDAAYVGHDLPLTDELWIAQL